MVARQRCQIRICLSGEDLTGAAVYRGHDQISSETPSTAKIDGLGTHLTIYP
jgi:hypothetical protein